MASISLAETREIVRRTLTDMRRIVEQGMLTINQTRELLRKADPLALEDDRGRVRTGAAELPFARGSSLNGAPRPSRAAHVSPNSTLTPCVAVGQRGQSGRDGLG
jgi:hypothetical protein